MSATVQARWAGPARWALRTLVHAYDWTGRRLWTWKTGSPTNEAILEPAPRYSYEAGLVNKHFFVAGRGVAASATSWTAPSAPAPVLWSGPRLPLPPPWMWGGRTPARSPAFGNPFGSFPGPVQPRWQHEPVSRATGVPRAPDVSGSVGGRGEISAADRALLEDAQDGHSTLDEANAWWRHAEGADLEVDASRLRVHTRNGINGTVQGDDYFVHGQVTLNPATGRIYDGAYDFDYHQPGSPLDVGTHVRNLATRIGEWRAGPGTQFTIRYRGQPTIIRPAPHNNSGRW